MMLFIRWCLAWCILRIVAWLAWTTPRDWTADELVTATIMNTHVRDNLNALKSPPSTDYVINESSDYAPSTTSFEDIDATNLALSITPSGSEIMVHFHGMVFTTGATTNMFFDIDIGGSRVAGDDGIIGATVSANASAITFTRLITGLTPGATITVKLQWKCNGLGVRLASGAGTSNRDVHAQFWAREVS